MTYEIIPDKYNGLANRRLQPLGHLSSVGNPYIICGFRSNLGPQIPHMDTNKSERAGRTKGNSHEL